MIEYVVLFLWKVRALNRGNEGEVLRTQLDSLMKLSLKKEALSHAKSTQEEMAGPSLPIRRRRSHVKAKERAGDWFLHPLEK